jgi:signal transduction histidine kinase
MLSPPYDSELPRVTDGGSTILQIQGGRRLRVRRASFYDRGTQRGFLLLEELTEELQASERGAYDKLIRMMSHEVNNSVGVVRSLLDSCRHYEQQLKDQDRAEFGQAMEVAVDRLLHLSSFMNGLARVVRIPAPDSRPCGLTPLMNDIAVLMGPELERRQIQLTWEPPTNEMLVHCDKNQIEQVVVNILQNAMEAIGSDGTIELQLSLVDRAPELSVIDSGPGIPSETASKLFTPFFSTKRDGQGVGLTLSREILSQHGFSFSLTNEPELGARFRIRFSS